MICSTNVNCSKQFGSDWMESIPFKNHWFYVALPVSGTLIILYVIRDEVNQFIELINRKG